MNSPADKLPPVFTADDVAALRLAAQWATAEQSACDPTQMRHAGEVVHRVADFLEAEPLGVIAAMNAEYVRGRTDGWDARHSADALLLERVLAESAKWENDAANPGCSYRQLIESAITGKTQLEIACASDHQRAKWLAQARAWQPVTVKAKPLEWEDDDTTTPHDKHWGFWIDIDDGGDQPVTAGWDEGDLDTFDTVEEAKAWCQALADEHVTKIAEAVT